VRKALTSLSNFKWVRNRVGLINLSSDYDRVFLVGHFW